MDSDIELMRQAANLMNDKLVGFWNRTKGPPFHTCCLNDVDRGHKDSCLVSRLRARVRAG